MGGGGFSMSDNGSATAFDRYLVELSGVSSPLVCFAPTASGDDPGYIRRFLTAFGALGVRTMILTLWTNAAESVKRLQEADIVYVGGGSTANLLALWKTHHVDQAINRMIASSRTLVLGGLSAGGACWYQSCLTDSFGDYRPWLHGLGLLSGSFCPHYDGEKQRQSIYTNAVANGVLPAGWALEDGAALHWKDGELLEGIAERPSARGWHVEYSSEPTTGGVISLPVNMQRLV